MAIDAREAVAVAKTYMSEIYGNIDCLLTNAMLKSKKGAVRIV